MSAPWKGYMSPSCIREFHHSPCHVHREPLGSAQEPVLVQPIDDESLPHPGDGKDWETQTGLRVTILSPPYKVRETWEVVAETHHSDGSGATFSRRPCAYLRERKPEPEHRPWCERSTVPDYSPPDVCTCERRSGEERRKAGERREAMKGRREWDTTRRPFHISGDRRSGTDRRQSS